MIDRIFERVLDYFNSVTRWAGDSGQFNFRFIRAQSFDPTTLIYFLFGLSLTILTIVLLVYRYQRWKRYNEFVDEMRALDLDPESEGTLAFMVKRYSLDEPVNVLMSAKTFDDMAQKEMIRVLSSPGSQQAKEDFIDKVYKIRNKTYQPEWLKGEAW